MRYFKRFWNEPRSGAQSVWGCSWWYFETDAAGIVSRQIEVYDRGPTLRYHLQGPQDEFGRLTDQPLDLLEFASYEIEPKEFEQAWAPGG